MNGQRKELQLNDFSRIPLCESGSGEDNHRVIRRYRIFVRNAVEALPEMQKQVVTLYYYHGNTMEQIASIVGVHCSTVSRQLSAARSTLKSIAGICLKTDLFTLTEDFE